jgi:Fic family protein
MNLRQEAVLNFINAQKQTSASKIHKHISEKFENVSRITIIRDLDFLIESGFIKKQGQARAVRYYPVLSNPLLEYFNIEDYFQKDCDDRVVKNQSFNFDIFSNLHSLFSSKELDEIVRVNEKFQSNLKKSTPAIVKKEFERLTIEFSWKSSRIEGNTYSLLDTERLIKENVEASGHSKEESTMILNHKRALDYIFQNVSYYKLISFAKIEDLHQMLIDGLGVRSGLRSSPVGIIGTNYKPLDNKYQIEDAIKKLVDAINANQNPFEKAMITALMISYIQPFEDGNKRTSRILSNAILLAYDYCPLSYKSVDEAEYKKAVVIFYEQNSAAYFKKLFISQFEQAVERYF